jgi:DNA-binding transcriptional LysR family regulator
METISELRRMAIFAAVVDTGSFSAAAHRLGMAKSGVSKQVSILESHLELRLINRTTRSLHLTEAGEAFYPGCARILAEAEAAHHAVGRLQDEATGVLKISAPVAVGRRYLAPILARYSAENPGVELDVLLDDAYVDLITEGVDVAVRLGDLEDSSLVARRLASVRRVLVASPDYFESHGRPERPSELTRHRWMHYSYGPQPPRLELQHDGRRERVSLPGRGRSNDVEIMRALLHSGQCICDLPILFVLDDLAQGTLEEVLPDCGARETSLNALFPPTRHLLPKVRLFLDALVERFSEPPWAGA